MSNDHFTKALSDMTHDIASGGAIRHLADLGLSVSAIRERLDFPTPVERIGETVWKHYVSTGVIRLSAPDESGSAITRTSYIKEQDSYGRTSFRQVRETLENTSGEYLECDFGIRMHKDREAFMNSLKALSDDDREYIIGLPWPRALVWHISDERMKRILGQLNK